MLNRKGLAYIRTYKEQRLTRLDTPALVQHEDTVEVENIKTPLVGHNKKRLLDIIQKFSS